MLLPISGEALSGTKSSFDQMQFIGQFFEDMICTDNSPMIDSKQPRKLVVVFATKNCDDDTRQ